MAYGACKRLEMAGKCLQVHADFYKSGKMATSEYKHSQMAGIRDKGTISSTVFSRINAGSPRRSCKEAPDVSIRRIKSCGAK